MYAMELKYTVPLRPVLMQYVKEF